MGRPRWEQSGEWMRVVSVSGADPTSGAKRGLSVGTEGSGQETKEGDNNRFP